MWLYVCHSSVSGFWCQMKTDGRGFCQGLGPAPGSCPWRERFHLLVDVRQPDSSRPWIKMVWAGRLWGQSPVSGWPCCSAQTRNAIFIINAESISVWLLLWLDKLVCCRVLPGSPVRQNSNQDPDFSLRLWLSDHECFSKPKPTGHTCSNFNKSETVTVTDVFFRILKSGNYASGNYALASTV